ncbi:hypothetical protein F5X97DRAFT_298087 [Nemania serpens]|nr:hypothetical protein F5X97DRAFT_298087 [Nemania serpens]
MCDPDTKLIRAYPYEYRGCTVWLVDTPGFDDTVRPDIDVLEDLAFWLKVASDQKFQLAGIIHLHRITDIRMGGAAYKDLKMFQKFCGQESFPSVVLATTMWPKNPSKEEIGREEELRTRFYQNMIDEGRGAKMVRHMNTKDSAAAIISQLVDRVVDKPKSQPLVLAIQRELAPKGARLLDTGAGRELEGERIRIRESFEKQLKENQRRLDLAMEQKDKELVDMRKQQQARLEEMLVEARKREEETRARLEAQMEERFEEKDKLFREMQEQFYGSDGQSNAPRARSPSPSDHNPCQNRRFQQKNNRNGKEEQRSPIAVVLFDLMSLCNIM